jgi:signal transduction histidine kinase
MKNTEEQHPGLLKLAAHLETQHETILQTWRKASEDDAVQGVMASMSRSEFFDHMPQILESFEERLRLWPEAEASAVREAENHTAWEHGAHRWQQGYNLQEMAREWSLFNVVVVEALDGCAISCPDVSPEALSVARRILAELIGESIANSVAEFARLQRAGAEVRARDLETLLVEREDLDRERSHILRDSAHDLRGGLSVIRGVGTILGDPRLPEGDRQEMVQILQRAGESLHGMLSQMLDLARLEAGREKRNVETFDVAQLLQEMGASLQLTAQAKDLALEWQGPEQLEVQGDRVKVGRIAQNLMLNAVKYTLKGSVSLSWREHEKSGEHWALQVQDTGPGIAQESAAPLMKELKATTQSAREVGAQSGPEVSPFGVDEPSQPIPTPHSEMAQGEGVGLMIVKGLCELLDATLEVESKVGQGSIFRVVFPRKYNS